MFARSLLFIIPRQPQKRLLSSKKDIIVTAAKTADATPFAATVVEGGMRNMLNYFSPSNSEVNEPNHWILNSKQTEISFVFSSNVFQKETTFQRNPTVEKILQPVPIPSVDGPLIPRPQALQSMFHTIAFGGSSFSPYLGYSGEGKTTLMRMLLNSIFMHQSQPAAVVACHVDFRDVSTGSDPMAALTKAVGSLQVQGL
jgi:hypothetical protein